MVIVVVSDIHLGYEHSDVDNFSKFLDEQLGRNDVESFVILGDFIDMWRRDVSGLFLENHDILEKVLKLQSKKIPLYCVAGNHDYHLLQLTKFKYPLVFQNELNQKDSLYRFKHGHEFDFAQQPAIMELLCHNFSDKSGEFLSKFWEMFKAIGHDIKELELVAKYKGPQGYLDHLLTPPKHRLVDISVEKEARKDRDDNGKILIFGHTHRPFVSSKGDLANSGSWVRDEEPHNTYLELDGKKITLMQYGKGDITSSYIRDF